MLVYLSKMSGHDISAGLGEGCCIFISRLLLLLQCVHSLPGISVYGFLGCVASIFRTCLQAPEWVLGLPPLTLFDHVYNKNYYKEMYKESNTCFL